MYRKYLNRNIRANNVDHDQTAPVGHAVQGSHRLPFVYAQRKQNKKNEKNLDLEKKCQPRKYSKN